MRSRSTTLVVMSTAAMALAFCAPMVFSAPAMAQASGMAGLGESDTISLRATVKSVDLKSRVVTLVGPLGNTLALKVSDDVRNLPQVRPGNKVSRDPDGNVFSPCSVCPRSSKRSSSSSCSLGPWGSLSESILDPSLIGRTIAGSRCS